MMLMVHLQSGLIFIHTQHLIYIVCYVSIIAQVSFYGETDLTTNLKPLFRLVQNIQLILYKSNSTLDISVVPSLHRSCADISLSYVIALLLSFLSLC